MPKIESYRDLLVWQKAMDLAVECHRLTRSYPKEELFGLTSQIRRAANSIAANTAEGWGRNYTKEFIQFLWKANGSLKELETHLILSHRVEIVPETAVQPFLSRTEEIGKMLSSLIGSLEKRVSK